MASPTKLADIVLVVTIARYGVFPTRKLSFSQKNMGFLDWRGLQVKFYVFGKLNIVISV